MYLKKLLLLLYKFLFHQFIGYEWHIKFMNFSINIMNFINYMIRVKKNGIKKIMN